jgi:2-hydroxychromene-2-carboxylate isomerase
MVISMVRAEFHFDFGSPNAYLAHTVIPGIERRTGARFAYVPVLLGGIFKLTNNQSPVTAFAGIRNKLEYERLRDAALYPPPQHRALPAQPALPGQHAPDHARRGRGGAGRRVSALCGCGIRRPMGARA